MLALFAELREVMDGARFEPSRFEPRNSEAFFKLDMAIPLLVVLVAGSWLSRRSV